MKNLKFDLKPVSFKDIPVGDVFAFEGCISIFYKTSEDKAIFLATDTEDDGAYYYWVDNDELIGQELIKQNRRFINKLGERSIGTISGYCLNLDCYKLSKEVQEIWKVE